MQLEIEMRKDSFISAAMQCVSQKSSRLRTRRASVSSENRFSVDMRTHERTFVYCLVDTSTWFVVCAMRMKIKCAPLKNYHKFVVNADQGHPVSKV